MPRLLVLSASIVAALALGGASASARPPAAQGTGVIFWAAEIGCGAQVQVGSDVVTVFSSDSSFIAGTLFDSRVGWTCTGSVVPGGSAVAGPAVMTGLACSISNDFYPAFGPPPGTLSTSGTAIFRSDGTVRLICPPGERV